MRVTFKQMQDTLLPGFKTTGKSFDFLSKGLMGMGNILSKRLGLGDMDEYGYTIRHPL